MNALETLTLVFPNQTTITVELTNRRDKVLYRDLKDGDLFMLEEKVYERQDRLLAAQLLPWDDSDYRDFTGHERVLKLRTVPKP